MDTNTGEVTAIGAGTVVLTASLKDNASTKDEKSFNITPLNVKLRVEGVSETLFAPTDVEINSLKVKEGVDYYNSIVFDAPVPFLAAKNLLNAKGVNTSLQEKFDFSSNGNWMITINGYKPTQVHGNNASFMLVVNNVMANKGAGEQPLKENDYVVIFTEQNWERFEAYTFFENEEYTVNAGEELTVKLFKSGFDMNSGTPLASAPCSGATILKGNEKLLRNDGSAVVTSGNGEFKYTFEQEGTYVISANKINNGINYISRPYAVVKVLPRVSQPLNISSVDAINDIRVPYGTNRNDLNLPQTVKATLSNNQEKNLTLSWTDSTPTYNANNAGEYIFKANYELPEGVVGAKPEVSCKVIVEERPNTPVTVVRVGALNNINVAHGTLRNNLNLPTKAQLFLSNGSSEEVNLTWLSSVPTYDAQRAGTYLFTASYELPNGVTGAKPTITVQVTVAEAQNENDIEAWAFRKMNEVADEMRREEFITDWWIISEIVRLGKPINEQELLNLKIKTFKETGEVNDDLANLAKSVLSLRAAGINPEKFYGFNLVEVLKDVEPTRGMWDLAPKLWALSSDDYEDTDLTATIESLIDTIIRKQEADGLWYEWGMWQDATGFALYGLAPYYDRPEVKAAFEKAVNAISSKQTSNGDVYEYPGNNNSLVMVAGGLWSAKPEYLNDPRLVKNGKTMLHALKEYEFTDKPYFRWKKDETNVNKMATEQTFRALLTLYTKKNQDNYVFDYRDIPKRAMEGVLTKITGATKLQDIVVPYGTLRENISLPTHATVSDSLGRNHQVKLFWIRNTVPMYNPEQPGEYLFKSTYPLPQDVYGVKPDITVKVTVLPENATPPISVLRANPIADINVAYGTEKENAGLPATGELVLSDGRVVNVNLSWADATPEYNKTQAGAYVFKATYNLPEGVSGTKPEITAKVIVAPQSTPQEITVTRANPIADINVAYGTEKENAGLPATGELVLSDGRVVNVNLSWSDVVPAYTKTRPGKYIFKATYNLPEGVSGTKPLITAKVTVGEKPSEPTFIVSIDDVKAIIVQKGTALEIAKNNLQKTTLIKDNKNDRHIVQLDWTIENYNADTPADYVAKAVFVLPEGVEQSNPAKELVVETTVKVSEQPSATTPTVEKTHLEKLIDEITRLNLNSNEYPSDLFDDLNTKLENAKSILTNTNATQDDVNENLDLLQKAESALVKKSELVKDTIMLAEAHLMDKFMFVAEDIQKVESEYNALKNLITNSATKNQLQQAENNLFEAISKIRKKQGDSSSPNTSGNMTVYFSIRARERGGDAIEMWLNKTAYTIPVGSRVVVLVDTALRGMGLEYENRGGNYISKIMSPIDGQWFGEFDNGRLSGWMYSVNDNHTELGVAEQPLNDQDYIEWYYTNDYTKEKGSEKWGNKPYDPNNPSGPSTPNNPGSPGGGAGAPTDKLQPNPEQKALNPNVTTATEVKEFKDVPKGRWYSDSVYKLVERGILKGKSEDRFEPAAKVTRAEFIAMLSRIKDENLSNYSDTTSADVSSKAWYNDVVGWAISNNIAKGSGNSFRPNASITREEIAVIIANYLKYNNAIVLDKKAVAASQDNANISDWAKESVDLMKAYGIMSGRENNNFAPKELATRAEIAALIARLIAE